jgi:nifR3 family TIM-barrel protein
MKKNFWSDLEKPILVLAPMAGYTESPFRRMVKEIEPSVILVSELISCEAIRHNNEKTRRMIEFHPDEKNYYGVQLFGSRTESFIEAAKVVEEIGADFIDLNFGCPSPKIVNSGNGSALLKDPDSSAKMIEKLVKSTTLPVTVKMRLGFYNDEDLVNSAKNFESAGISALAIHGRTTVQKFEGHSNWEKIYEVKENLKIPVIGNGDIDSAEKARDFLQNLDGIMIGRAALKNPWIFKQCREIFAGKPVSAKPEIREQLAFFRRQAELSTEFKGEKWAMIELRKHFAHIARGFHNAAKFREKLIRIESLAELDKIFAEMLNEEKIET